MNAPVRLWRCTKCEKWSHARRDPKTHQRWDDAEGDFVACGPFDAWVAERQSSYNRHAVNGGES